MWGLMPLPQLASHQGGSMRILGLLHVGMADSPMQVHGHLGNATSGGSSNKSNDHEGGNGDEEAGEFDAKLEKRRKHRADMKQNTLSKLDRLVDVAARLEHVEEELAKAAADKKPDDKLLTRAEWETIKQSSNRQLKRVGTHVSLHN